MSKLNTDQQTIVVDQSACVEVIVPNDPILVNIAEQKEFTVDDFT